MIHLILIGKSMMVQALMNIVSRLGNWRFEFVDNREDALERARQILSKSTSTT